MGKKQHYIPQFYLKNFSDISQKSIGVYRFEKQKYIRNASIKNIAYRNHLYDEDDLIESFLSEEEGNWKKMVDIFLGKNVTQTTLTMLQEQGEEYFINLFRFISITQARTTQLGDALSYEINTMEERLGKEMLPETYEIYFGGIDEITKHPNLIPIKVALDNIPFFAGLDLLVIYNSTRQLFITSDVPVLDINPYYEKRHYKRNYGLMAMGLQKLLPVSGRVCLCLYDRNVYERSCKEASWFLRSKRIVNQINNLLVENAYEQIFFDNSENEKYIRKLCDTRKTADNKGRITFFGKDKPELIWMHEKIVKTSFLLPCLRIRKEAFSISLPTNMAGLIRPDVQPLYDEQAQKIESEAQHAMQQSLVKEE